MPDRGSARRPRTPSPTRELGMERDRLRERDRHDPQDGYQDELEDDYGSKTPVGGMDDYRKTPMSMAEQYANYSPQEERRIRKQNRDSPPRTRQTRRLSPPEYDEYGHIPQGSSRRSRSPSRREDGRGSRRSRSEVRTEMEYDRHQDNYRNRARTPVQALDTSSLPNSPSHFGQGGSPSSTPSTPRKHRQLPRVPGPKDKG